MVDGSEGRDLNGPGTGLFDDFDGSLVVFDGTAVEVTDGAGRLFAAAGTETD